jgi:signal transduction histidine kinase
LYRIVQESLSNAVRHGAPRRIRIAIEWSMDGARVQVINDGAPETSATPGYGLTGMAARVAAAGGTLSAGPTAGGAWSVEARLPIKAEAREEAVA